MSNSYEINEHEEVVPYSGGRMCTDTRAWRDATELELQQRDEIESLSARLQRSEELLRESRTYVADATAGTVDMDWQSPREQVTARIDAFLGESHD